MKKYILLGLILGLGFVASIAGAVTILSPCGGGTGYATTTSANVGKFLQISTSSPCIGFSFGSGGGGTVGPSTSTYIAFFDTSSTINGSSTFTFSSSTGLVTIGTSTDLSGPLANISRFFLNSNEFINGSILFDPNPTFGISIPTSTRYHGQVTFGNYHGVAGGFHYAPTLDIIGGVGFGGQSVAGGQVNITGGPGDVCSDEGCGNSVGGDVNIQGGPGIGGATGTVTMQLNGGATTIGASTTLSQYLTCTLKTDGSGLITCGTDNTGGGGTVGPSTSTYIAVFNGTGTLTGYPKFIYDGSDLLPSGTGTNSIQIGLGATASQTNNVAIGTNAIASGNNFAVAIGGNALAQDYYDIAIGGDTVANGSAVAIGAGASTTGAFSIAMGYNTRNRGDNNLIFGSNQNATGSGNVSIGEGAASESNSSVIIGNNTQATGADNSIAIGSYAKVLKSNCLSLGHDSACNSTGTIMFGPDLEDDSGFTQMYLGQGLVNVNASPFAIRVTGRDGTNATGSDLTLATGKSTGSGVGGGFHFQTSNVGGSGVSLNDTIDRMVITGSGSVGIGTTQPSSTLHIVGNSKITASSTWPSYPNCTLKTDGSGLAVCGIDNSLVTSTALTKDRVPYFTSVTGTLGATVVSYISSTKVMGVNTDNPGGTPLYVQGPDVGGLTGSIFTDDGVGNIVGSGTLWARELVLGSWVTDDAEGCSARVLSITDDTHMTVAGDLCGQPGETLLTDNPSSYFVNTNNSGNAVIAVGTSPGGVSTAGSGAFIVRNQVTGALLQSFGDNSNQYSGDFVLWADSSHAVTNNMQEFSFNDFNRSGTQCLGDCRFFFFQGGYDSSYNYLTNLGLYDGGGTGLHNVVNIYTVGGKGRLMINPTGLQNATNTLDVAGGEAVGASYGGTFLAPPNGLIVQGNVGIGTSQPSSSLHVAGGLNFASFATFTTTSTISSSTYRAMVAVTSSVTLTLPSATSSGPGHLLSVKDKTGNASGTVVITLATATSSQKIDGAATVALPASAAGNWGKIKLFTDGLNWFIE